MVDAKLEVCCPSLDMSQKIRQNLSSSLRVVEIRVLMGEVVDRSIY